MTCEILPGCTVALTTRNGSTFAGVLHSLDETSGKIVLNNVTTAGSKLCGPQHFYRSGLINFQILSEPSGVSSRTKRVHGKSEGWESFDNSETATDSGDQGFGSGEDWSVTDTDYYEMDGYSLIGGLCEQFYDAIVNIMDQDIVGVSFEGVNIGRNGTLSLIQIATESTTYIFDMLRLGRQAFDEGLQAVFEASNLIKVIHDCRWISDMMHEKYNIRMVNIFDTQVASAFVYKIMHHGDWPRNVENLQSCLVKHLNLPLENVNFTTKEKLSEKEQSVWLQRPLSADLLTTTKKSCSHLIHLYYVLINKLLYEFRMGVELHLSHVRKLNGDLESCRMHSHKLPSIFREIPKLVNYTYSDNDGVHSSKSYPDSFDMPDKQLMFGQDFVWHRSKGNEMYKKDLKSKEKVKPLSSRGRGKHNNTLNDRGDACDSSMRISDSSSRTPSKEILQDNIFLDEESSSSTHQNLNTLLSAMRTSNVSSRNAGKNSCKGNTDLENILEYRNQSGFPAPTDGNKIQNSMFAGWSEKLVPSSKTDQLESQVENILISENRHEPSTESSPDGTSCLRRSRLWQAAHAKESDNTSELSSELIVPFDNSHQSETLASDTTADYLFSDDEISKSCVFSANRAEATNRIASFECSKFNRSSSFEDSEFDNTHVTPRLLDSSNISQSSMKISPNKSSGMETDRSLCLHGPGRRTESDLDSFSIVPAGFRGERTNRKTRNKQKCQPINAHDLTETGLRVTPVEGSPPMEDDLGSIPMQCSLKRLQELPLGATHGFGDLFSDADSLHQCENVEPLVEPHLTPISESAVEDTDLTNIHQSKLFQNALKMASSSSSGNLRRKLLPPKTSPSGSNSSHS